MFNFCGFIQVYVFTTNHNIEERFFKLAILYPRIKHALEQGMKSFLLRFLEKGIVRLSADLLLYKGAFC